MARDPGKALPEKEIAMPLYMTQFSYTPEAWAALARSPQDRTKTVAALAQQLGARVVNLYFCFGEYDAIVMAEAPDDTTAAAFVIAAVGAGHLKTTRTTRLFTAEEGVEMMRKAGTATIQPPGTTR